MERGRRTDPPGYTAWRNWFLGIDSWALLKIKNWGCEPVFVSRLRNPGINSIDSQSGRIVSSESISGLLKRLQIRALDLSIKDDVTIILLLGVFLL
jgi:hypothetical protein